MKILFIKDNSNYLSNRELKSRNNKISTPATERNWTRKIILEWEKEELQAMVSARKTRLSGKRKVIDGDSLISTVEKLNGVREAERITRERGAKMQKVSNKRVFNTVTRGRSRTDANLVQLN